MTGTFQQSYQTRQIIALLSAADYGDEISYQQIADCCEAKNINHCRSNLSTARRSLAEEGFLFDTQHGVGLKRMTDAEIAKSCPEDWRRSVNRGARRLRSNLGAINNFGKLSDKDQLSVFVAQAQAASAQRLASRKSTRQLTDLADIKQRTLEITETLNAVSLT